MAIRVQYVIQRLNDPVVDQEVSSDEEIPNDEINEIESEISIDSHELLISQTLFLNEFGLKSSLDTNHKGYEEFIRGKVSNHKEYDNVDKSMPIEMQSKPKIPRTPIPSDELEEVRKENELIKKSIQIRVNEEANIKKRRVMDEDNINMKAKRILSDMLNKR
jgi:hypothetical protein